MRSANKILLFITCVGVALVASCGSEPSYTETVKSELARSERFDSIAYGIHLGMTFDDFKWVCLLQNRAGLFKPNPNGNAVQLTFKEHFSYPALFEFFPANISGQYDTIRAYDATLKYRDYSQYNQRMKMENLVGEAIEYFESGYGGNDFFEIPKDDDPWVKYKYVKIDGNRQISLIPTLMGSNLTIKFEDLEKMNKAVTN